MDQAKEHYTAQFHPQRKFSNVNRLTYKFIERLNGIQSVFEFGCNVGRHLLHFRKKGFVVFGIDLNATQIFEARFINKLNTVEVGDELSLKDIPDNAFDLVFTNSVLCHIEEIDEIMKQLQRISRKHIVMVEANERQGKFWWPHDYIGKEKFACKSTQGITYKLYHYVK